MLVVCLIEAFEDFALLVNGDAASRILYLKEQLVILFLQGHCDVLAFTCVFEGIGKQIDAESGEVYENVLEMAPFSCTILKLK